MASCPCNPTAPSVNVSAVLSERVDRAALEACIQAEKARNAPSLDLGKSVLWVKRQSVMSAADEETGV